MWQRKHRTYGLSTPGQILKDRYLLVDPLDHGGEGEVWEAFDLLLERPVALKCLLKQHRDDHDAQERLRHEARAYGRLGCLKGLVAIFGYEENRGEEGPFLVMELLRGVTLRRYIQDHGRFSPARLGVLGGQLCRLVGDLHHRGAVHRDLSSRNVFLHEREDGTKEMRLLDLSMTLLPKLQGEGYEPHPCGGGGTPARQAPELSDTCEGDARSDIYSLGVILYEMATGSPLTTNRYDSKKELRRELHPRVQEPTLSEDLEKVILHCLALSPKERYAHADELADALALTTGVTALASKERAERKPAALLRPSLAKRRPKRSFLPLTLAFLLAALLGGAYFLAPGAAPARTSGGVPLPTRLAASTTLPSAPAPVALPPASAPTTEPASAERAVSPPTPPASRYAGETVEPPGTKAPETKKPACTPPKKKSKPMELWVGKNPFEDARPGSVYGE